MIRRLLLIAALALVLVEAPAGAHTEPDVVGIPAGEPATVNLRPTHGCDDSPTIAVSTRVPFAAEPGAVEGWTASATPDAEGRVVLEWTGGVLPADEVGAFPLLFTAPATAGELLVFPFIQECENGEELAWISGNPADEYPAPRVLVLPAGSAPAHTIDEVPVDAPGREQLTQVVDVDNPAGTTTTTTATTATTAAPSSSTTAAAPTPTAPEEDDSDDDSDVPWVPIAIAVAVVGVLATAQRRRRR